MRTFRFGPLRLDFLPRPVQFLIPQPALGGSFHGLHSKYSFKFSRPHVSRRCHFFPKRPLLAHATSSTRNPKLVVALKQTSCQTSFRALLARVGRQRRVERNFARGNEISDLMHLSVEAARAACQRHWAMPNKCPHRCQCGQFIQTCEQSCPPLRPNLCICDQNCSAADSEALACGPCYLKPFANSSRTSVLDWPRPWPITRSFRCPPCWWQSSISRVCWLIVAMSKTGCAATLKKRLAPAAPSK